jgi:uroporphyrinogen-III synthase
MGGLRLLVLRPAAEAEKLAVRLTALGHEPILSPLLTIRPLAADLPDPAEVQGWLVTSVNGAARLAELTALRDLPVFAVGRATATVLSEAGFTRIVSADGDGLALAALVAERCPPEQGRLVHVAGSDRAVDFDEILPDHRVIVLETYAADPVAALPETAVAALRALAVDGVLLTSPRLARHFTKLVQADKLAKTCTRMTAYSLSAAVSDAAALPFGRKRVAARPDLDSLLDLLEEPPAMTSPKPEEAVQAAAPSRETGAVQPNPDAANPDAAGAPDVASVSVPAASLTGGFRPVIGGFIGGLGGAAVVVALLAATVDGWRPLILPVVPAATPLGDTARLTALETGMADLRTRVAQAVSAQAAARSAAPSPSPVQAAPFEAAPLLARLAELERQLAALPSGAATGASASPAPAVDLAPLTDRLADLEKRQSQAAEAAEVAALQKELQALKSRQTAAETTAGGQLRDLVRRSGLALATAQMALAAREGRDFAVPLKVLTGLAGDEAAFQEPLAALAPLAGGMPSVASLRDRFAAAAKAAKTAELVDQETGWLAEVERLLGHLVTLRRIDQPVTDSLDDRLARVEALLEAGTLSEVPAVLAGLDGTVATALAPWLKQVEARLAADRALSRLAELVLAAAPVKG